MTDKEQIIIDGVDVSKCDFYDRYKKYCLTLKMYPEGFKYSSCFSGDFQQCIQDSKTCPYTFCHNNTNCYFKQLARKTQEYEKLKKYIQEREVWDDDCEFCKHNDKENCHQNIILDNLKMINRYRKALEEIEEEATSLKCFNFGYDELGIGDDIVEYAKRILDIINKIRG